MYFTLRTGIAMTTLLAATIASAQVQNPVRQPGQAPPTGNVQQRQPAQVQQGQGQQGQGQQGQGQQGQGQQGQGQQVQQGQFPPGQRPGNFQGMSNDAILAACLMVGNQNEVTLAQMAQQRAKSDDVKEFAQRMQQDHQQMLSKLQQFAGNLAMHQPREQANEQPRPSQPTGVQPGAQPGASIQNQQPGAPVAAQGQAGSPMAGHLDLLSLKRELGTQCLQSTQKELSDKNGTEFDECFIGMQIAAHMHAIDEMKVFKHHVSPNMQTALDEGIQTAENHLKHAKGLIKELTGKDKSRTSSTRSESTTTNK